MIICVYPIHSVGQNFRSSNTHTLSLFSEVLPHWANTHSLSFSRVLTTLTFFSLSLSHTHTHTHSLSLCLFISVSFSFCLSFYREFVSFIWTVVKKIRHIECVWLPVCPSIRRKQQFPICFTFCHSSAILPSHNFFYWTSLSMNINVKNEVLTML